VIHLAGFFITVSFIMFGIGAIAFAFASITLMLGKLGVVEYSSRGYWINTAVLVGGGLISYLISVVINLL
tara:strand:+ start:77 stop:286 length:210 start_codon:yes stop_codon:yes gene_type:complete